MGGFGAGLADPVSQFAVTNPQSPSNIDDPALIIKHHRYRIRLELIGERPPNPIR
jgi:hypothetical protein